MPVMLGDAKSERVFLLLHTEGKEHDTGNLQDECITVLTHSVLEADGEAYARLESALKELNGLLKGFQLSDAVRDVHAIVGLLEPDGNLHLSHVGRAEAYLVRRGSTTQITEYARGKQPSAFMHIVSGPVEAKDHILISTHRLLRTITPAQLAGIVDQEDEPLEAIVSELESEKESACLVHLTAEGAAEQAVPESRLRGLSPTARVRLSGRRAAATSVVSSFFAQLAPPVRRMMAGARKAMGAKAERVKSRGGNVFSSFLADLSDPTRKRRAHLLLLAGAAGICIVVWVLIQISLTNQQSQSRGQLSTLIEQINGDLTTAENRKLAGDTESANTILQRAEDRARQVMGSETGLFRSEALNLLDRIRSKREQMNNIVRIPPTTLANLTTRKSDMTAQGFLGLSDGEFMVYDRQDLYRVLLNSVDAPVRLSPEELIVDGVDFPRSQTQVFLTTGNSVIELVNSQPTTMKTEDSAGWISGTDIKTYLRYLYVLAPDRKQIYKYEHLSGRYGPPTEYNVNGDLKGALDMTITGPVYVLKETGPNAGGADADREVLKLLRGEKQSFVIRNLPPGALKGVTKIFKSGPNGNIYFLDPTGKRVIVATNDGDLGESLYLKQYILDSEQVSTLQDLYVDVDDTRLYVLDEKRIYTIELQGK